MKIYYKLCILMALVVAGLTSPILPSIDKEEITMAEVIFTLQSDFQILLSNAFDSFCKLT